MKLRMVLFARLSLHSLNEFVSDCVQSIAVLSFFLLFLNNVFRGDCSSAAFGMNLR